MMAPRISSRPLLCGNILSLSLARNSYFRRPGPARLDRVFCEQQWGDRTTPAQPSNLLPPSFRFVVARVLVLVLVLLSGSLSSGSVVFVLCGLRML